MWRVVRDERRVVELELFGRASFASEFVTFLPVKQVNGVPFGALFLLSDATRLRDT